MDTAYKVTQAQGLIQELSAPEVEFLRRMVAGESLETIASQLMLAVAEAAAIKQSLMAKPKAEVTADAIRVGIYAGL